jgi:hypothetical protein
VQGNTTKERIHQTAIQKDTVEVREAIMSVLVTVYLDAEKEMQKLP